jgi:hypothetical protein
MSRSQLHARSHDDRGVRHARLEDRLGALRGVQDGRRAAVNISRRFRHDG